MLLWILNTVGRGSGASFFCLYITLYISAPPYRTNIVSVTVPPFTTLNPDSEAAKKTIWRTTGGWRLKGKYDDDFQMVHGYRGAQKACELNLLASSSSSSSVTHAFLAFQQLFCLFELVTSTLLHHYRGWRRTKNVSLPIVLSHIPTALSLSSSYFRVVFLSISHNKPPDFVKFSIFFFP